MNAGRQQQLRDRLLGPLHTHFLSAARAYGDYMENGKSFLFACSLRRTNASARQLLLDHGHFLPDELQPHAIALLRHYDVWLTLWDEAAATEKPSMEQAFVFENPVRFPREAQHALTAFYEQLQG
jgi:hypothetical protein